METHSPPISRRVADFYIGKSIFLTGASGFVGTVLLECLLRCCPGIRTIYILLRPKKGSNVQQRKRDILDKTIFDTLKRENPSALDKISIMEGDITLPSFGMSSSDLQTLNEEVSIVFHCAASIALIKPIEKIVKLNSKSVDFLITLLSEMKKLEVLVYTSTAFSNSNRSVIKEVIYRLPFPAQKFLDALNVGKEELQELVDECHPPWPNTYTFSKCLSENLLVDKLTKVPIGIVRPSLVGCVHRSPLPGYVEDSSGLTSLSMGVAKGFINVVWGDPQAGMNVVSVDAVANAHVISAWSLATGRHQSPLIMNAAQSRDVETIGSFNRAMEPLMRESIFPNAFSRPNYHVTIVKSALWFKVLAFVQHYVPAYIFDAVLQWNNKRPILVPLYKIYDKVLLSTYEVSIRRFKFICDNFEGLTKSLEAEDAKTFNTDLRPYNFKNIVDMLRIGAPFLDFKQDKRTAEERSRIINKRFWAIRFIKTTAMVAFFVTLYLAIVISNQLIQTVLGTAVH